MALKRITDLLASSALTGEEYMEISQVSTSIKLTDTSISAAASDNSFNDANSGFTGAGFAIGDRVRVTGFASVPANNLVIGVITALTAAKMTIGGTDGDVIADESAGPTVTIAKWTSRRALLDDIGIGAGGAYDVRFAFTTTPTTDEVLETIAIPRDIEILADMAGSVGIVGTNPTASFEMSLRDDGVEIGTVTVGTDGSFTFATSSGTAKMVASGSIVTLVAPTTVDATVADMVLTIAADQV